MASKPRTPRYWPRMNVRGARRRQNLWAYKVVRHRDLFRAAISKLYGFDAGIESGITVEWREPQCRTLNAQ